MGTDEQRWIGESLHTQHTPQNADLKPDEVELTGEIMDKNGNGERTGIERRSGADRRNGIYKFTAPDRRQKIRRCVVDRRKLIKLSFR